VFDGSDLRPLIERHVPGAGDVRFAPIRTGKFNSSYFVSSAAGEYVLRIAPPDEAVFCFYERGMMKQEPDIHRMLLERTTVPVARIVAFDGSRALVDRDYMLMERLPGVPLTEAAVDPSPVFRQLGAMLAQCHAIRAGRYGYLGAHRPMEPQESWVEAFGVMWRALLDDVEATGHYDRDERAGLEALLEGHLGHFDRPVDSSFLHMDIWHQNVLVELDGRVTGVVDWDRALWGDPEIEFAVLDYCGVSVPAFWEGYGTERDLSPAAQVRRVFYLLYELQKYIVIRHGRGGDPAGAARYKGQVMGIVREAFGSSPLSRA
jgi:aminoglycoside phosphotransferase (APT) family kinase protein